jgi:hypothetical protein
MPRPAPPANSPNVWIPRKILKERNSHPMAQAQGKGQQRSLMQPQALAASHPFYTTLGRWGSQGVPIDCGPGWNWEAIEAAVAWGPHRSALEPENVALVHEDIKYQVDAGFSTIMLWEDIKCLQPSSLKISPVAVVPKKDRRSRIILDLSFPVYRTRTKPSKHEEPIHASVNETTNRLAPDKPVREIGNVFHRVMHLLNSAEAGEVVMLSKIDLSDGFWRLIVEDGAQRNFSYVMPNPVGHPLRIVVPSALQTGWVDSPSYFYAATKTGRNVIAKLVSDKTKLPPHPLKSHMHPEQPAKCSLTNDPVHSMYVDVDDYIGAYFENKDGTLFGRILRGAPWHSFHFPVPCSHRPHRWQRPYFLEKTPTWQHPMESAKGNPQVHCRRREQNSGNLRRKSQQHCGQKQEDPKEEEDPTQTVPPDHWQAATCGVDNAGHQRTLLSHKPCTQRQPSCNWTWPPQGCTRSPPQPSDPCDFPSSTPYPRQGTCTE